MFCFFLKHSYAKYRFFTKNERYYLRNININCMDGQKKLLAVESIITGERVKIDALVRKCKSIMTNSTNQSMVNLLHSTLMEFLLAYTYIEKTIMIALIFKYRLLSSALTSTIDLSTFIMQRFPAGIESILENVDSLSLEKLNDGTIRDAMLSGTFYPISREVVRIIDDVKNTFKNVVCKCDGKLSDDERRNAVQLVKQGESRAAVGRRYGVCGQAITHLVTILMQRLIHH